MRVWQGVVVVVVDGYNRKQYVSCSTKIHVILTAGGAAAAGLPGGPAAAHRP